MCLFKDSTYKRYHICLWLTSVSMIISRSIHVAANGIISSFLWLGNIPLNTHAHLLYPFICQWMFTFVFQGTQKLLLALHQRVDQCFSNLGLYQNHLESFLKGRHLDSCPEFPTSAHFENEAPLAGATLVQVLPVQPSRVQSGWTCL